MKVGDYVRTDSGDIGIIINCPEQLKKNYGNWLWLETINEQRPIRNEDVIKSSPNIMDLIEVGDYVNGEKVYYLKGQIDEKEVAHEEDVLYTEYNDEYGDWYGYAKEEIETIVTHEQFEAMQYKVGE